MLATHYYYSGGAYKRNTAFLKMEFRLLTKRNEAYKRNFYKNKWYFFKFLVRLIFCQNSIKKTFLNNKYGP
jgi:hypothetical protein